MAITYCFKCRGCGAQWENSAARLGLHPRNGCKNPDVVRNYRAESVGVDKFALRVWSTRHQRRDPDNAVG